MLPKEIDKAIEEIKNDVSTLKTDMLNIYSLVSQLADEKVKEWKR